ncbi:hypothetical protein HYU15_04275 [Candidatus Woesearchaeota archaeon]|nr:hypothetical protein [Candidatus Woesearchaeota archaeon]
MDAQLAQKVSRLAHALKASGAATGNKEAYEVALELLEKMEKAAVNAPHNAATNTASTINNNSRTTDDNNSGTTGTGADKGVFLGKDSLGFELKGRTLKELVGEKQ